MTCPKCAKRMEVTHTYRAGDAGSTQRLECKCGCVGTAVTIMVNVDPNYGEGASVLAKKVAQKGISAVLDK